MLNFPTMVRRNAVKLTEMTSSKGEYIESEFLDISLAKDWSILLHAIHYPFYYWILKKTILFSGFKILAKNPRNKKSKFYS
jgi:hypothetical protein